AAIMRRSEPTRAAGPSSSTPRPCWWPAPKGFTPTDRERIAAATMRRPETIGVPQGPRSQRVMADMMWCLSRSVAEQDAGKAAGPWSRPPGVRRPTGRTCSRPCRSRRRSRRSWSRRRRVDLDAAGGELHADVLHALESADLLLDLGDAGGAAEALGAEDGVGAGGGGGGHGGPSFWIVVLARCSPRCAHNLRRFWSWRHDGDQSTAHDF